MSATCYLIGKQAGIDVFGQRPEDFHRLSDEMREKLRSEVLPAKLAFRNARLEMLNGTRIKGMFMLALVLLRHGRKALPKHSDRLTASLITEFARRYSDGIVKA
ncbi:hypothetical protein N7E02_23325 [Aliirhizobium terrae]|uniref:hypothetical protein n=1 Tax=Terrirhizobium terrae TaxID=2926709 RepID=UPI0025777537|nr:hypothetical protein [Rhizobium sp. CC-CFT758]WJH39665.1 hypothetical protein N7E02_23325 [Rhizobium sp. CC-CFT758]